MDIALSSMRPPLSRLQTLGEVHVEKSVEVILEKEDEPEVELQGYEKADRVFG